MYFITRFISPIEVRVKQIDHAYCDVDPQFHCMGPFVHRSCALIKQRVIAHVKILVYFGDVVRGACGILFEPLLNLIAVC